jgi:hypothetical protein
MSNRYVVCLKHGTKYDAQYVNVLKKMTQRNLTVAHEFVCFTEDPRGIDPDIRTLPLPNIQLKGWWFKTLLFNPLLPIQGTMLFIDLDVIVFKNIDKLFTHNPGVFMVCRDFNRCFQPDWKKMNSSVVRWNTGQHPQIYSNFIKDPHPISKRFHGDQDWLYDQVKKHYEFWPEEWIQSYKWEMRGNPKLIKQKSGFKNFAAPGEPQIKLNTAVAVFHGDPNPRECVDPWCQTHWY